MNNWVDLTNFAIASGGLVIAMLGHIMAVFTKNLKGWHRKYFIILFAVLMAYIFSDLISQISLELLGSSYGKLSQTAIFFESFLSSVAMPMLTILLLKEAGESRRGSLLFNVVTALWGAYVVILITTQFTTSIYHISADNVYQRGSWYPILLIPPIVIMAVDLLALMRRRSRLPHLYFKAFLLYILLPLFCMVIQMFLYGLLLIVVGTSIATLVMFLVLLYNQDREYALQQEENARQKARLAIMQMRPHFIYNVMTSIYYLCGQDPEKAQSVILDFSSYLRKNFTAITKEGTIPFTEELEHTRAYLAVERSRFEDKLFVDSDTPHVAFRLPPLTLQPIVENAVKHGIDPELRPLTITVTTAKTDDGSMITVRDNGPGFDPESTYDKPGLTAHTPDTLGHTAHASDTIGHASGTNGRTAHTSDTLGHAAHASDSLGHASGTNGRTAENPESHVTLSNIRERLEMMCGGTLTIQSPADPAAPDEGGTIVTIFIPD